MDGFELGKIYGLPAIYMGISGFNFIQGRKRRKSDNLKEYLNVLLGNLAVVIGFTGVYYFITSGISNAWYRFVFWLSLILVGSQSVFALILLYVLKKGKTWGNGLKSALKYFEFIELGIQAVVALTIVSLRKKSSLKNMQENHKKSMKACTDLRYNPALNNDLGNINLIFTDQGCANALYNRDLGIGTGPLKAFFHPIIDVSHQEPRPSRILVDARPGFRLSKTESEKYGIPIEPDTQQAKALKSKWMMNKTYTVSGKPSFTINYGIAE